MKKSIFTLIAVILSSSLAQADLSPVELLGRQEGRRDGLRTIITTLETYFVNDLNAQVVTQFSDEISSEVQILKEKSNAPILDRSAEILRAARGNNDYLIGFMDGSCQALTEALVMSQERKTRYHGNMERYDAAEAIEARLTLLKRTEFSYCD